MPRLNLHFPGSPLQRLFALLLCLFLVDPGLAAEDRDGAYGTGFSQASLLDFGLLFETDGVEGDDYKDLLATAAMPLQLFAVARPAKPGHGPGHDSSRLRAHPPRAPPQA